MKKEELKITSGYLNEIFEEAKYQILPDIPRIETFVQEWNIIVDNLDDPQDLFLELHRFSYNRFLAGHSFVDGNKRMHRALTNLINSAIQFEDIL